MKNFHNQQSLRVARLFLMDTSSSMEGQKIQELKSVLINLVASGQYYGQDLISLCSFANDFKELLHFKPIRHVNTDWVRAVNSLTAYGCTNMSSALFRAIGAMSAAHGFKKTIVLLSDGEPYPETADQVLSRIPVARKYHIRISTIGFGDARNIDIPLLQKLARSTGGTFQHAKAIHELANSLRKAA